VDGNPRDAAFFFTLALLKFQFDVYSEGVQRLNLPDKCDTLKAGFPLDERAGRPPERNSKKLASEVFSPAQLMSAAVIKPRSMPLLTIEEELIRFGGSYACSSAREAFLGSSSFLSASATRALTALSPSFNIFVNRSLPRASPRNVNAHLAADRTSGSSRSIASANIVVTSPPPNRPKAHTTGALAIESQASTSISGCTAHFSFLNKDGSIAADINRASQQMLERLCYIQNNYEMFRREFHAIRRTVEGGATKYHSLLGPKRPLHVDPEKDVKFRGVVIGGRLKDDYEESHVRHQLEKNNLNIRFETWDSWLRKCYDA
jgi:hypothetical protein